MCATLNSREHRVRIKVPILVSALLSLWLCGCSRSSTRDGTIGFRPERAVVLDPHSMRTWQPCRTSTTAGISGFWTPESGEIERIDSLLPRILSSGLKRVDPSTVLHPALYYRQYVGIVQNGRRLIYVNGFHEGYISMIYRSYEQSPAGAKRSDLDVDFWKYTPVTVCDGGVWYFGITYDPATKRFGSLEFEHTFHGEY